MGTSHLVPLGQQHGSLLLSLHSAAAATGCQIIVDFLLLSQLPLQVCLRGLLCLFLFLYLQLQVVGGKSDSPRSYWKVWSTSLCATLK